MKKSTSILWGIVLIIIGVLIAAKSFGLAQINLFFDGWWTLFIIIPCLIGLFTERDKTGNLIGIIIGIFLLLCCQDILSFSFLWKLIIPFIIVAIGIKMIFGGVFSGKANKYLKELDKNKTSENTSNAVFSGNNMNFDGKAFNGADLNAVFGGVECDLRGAVIEEDCAIKASAIFGGIDIFVPYNVNVEVNSNSIFGGVSNKTKHNKEAKATIYINCSCMFGGVDIK